MNEDGRGDSVMGFKRSRSSTVTPFKKCYKVVRAEGDREAVCGGRR